jgi:hypothetical protein
MKYLKRFNEQEKSIVDWCEELVLFNYTINDDNTVDSSKVVNISNKKLKVIPIQFGLVYGSFNCNENKLRTLKGSPKEVYGNFFCSDNKLRTLIGGPKKVIRYYCYRNDLISLEGCPLKIGNDDIIRCDYNRIYNIYKLFPTHESYLESLDYKYLREEKIVKKRLDKALIESGITVELPDSIPGYKYI